MRNVEIAWAASPAADDPELVDRIVAWAEADWPAWRMQNAARREGFRHAEDRPYTAEELWSVVTIPEFA